MPTLHTRSLLLLANPTAGRGGAAERMEAVADHLRAAGATATTHQTRSTDDATERAAAAATSGEIAVALGGDGLARAVARGVAQSGGVMGLIPAGRGNDFARWAGLPEEPKAAAELLLTASPRAVDGIHVTPASPSETAFALGNVYLGFDSLSNVAANRQRLPWGRFAYSVAALRVALTMPVLDLSITVDGEVVQWQGSGIAIANGPFYGGAIAVAPAADPTDGLLDLVLFAQTSRRDRVATLLALRGGSHLARPGVRLLRGREIEVQVAPEIEAYADGDPIAPVPFRASVQPGALRLLLP